MPATLHELPNVNALWAHLLVEELVRQGIDHFVIAPGSRSTPLVVAAVRNARARTHLVRDERAAGYFAVGLWRGGGRPAAVITTSGTAVANLAPAVMEAGNDGVPLLLLTADRPAELHDCGANQAAGQLGLFGEHLRWAVDVAPPDDAVPARFVLATAAEAAARCRAPAGPVHVNMRFREPLAPTPTPWSQDCLAGLDRWAAGDAPWSVRCQTPAIALEHVPADLGAGSRILLVAGHLPTAADRDTVHKLSRTRGWPLVADMRSGLRLGRDTPTDLPFLDRCLASVRPPDVVVQFGGMLTSKRLLQGLATAAPETWMVADPRALRHDPDHRATHVFEAPAGLLARALLGGPPRQHAAADIDDGWRAAHAAVEATLRREIDAGGALTEPWVGRWLSAYLPADSGLFLSSSMPIRDVQEFAVRGGPPLHVAANRGASGIDGVLACAAGFATGLGRPTTLLIGDQALIHDLGSLALLRDLEQPLLVVVTNNGGGSIFSGLPVALHDDVFSPWFDARHDFSFGGACGDFGVAYARATSRAELEQACGAALRGGGAYLVEVASRLQENAAEHTRLRRAVDAAVAEALA